MRDIFSNVAWDENLRWTCDENYYGNEDNSDYDDVIVYQLTIPQGYAFECMYEGQLPTLFVKSGNGATEEDGTARWFSQNTGSLRVDGIPISCSSYYYPKVIGGEYDMNLIIEMDKYLFLA